MALTGLLPAIWPSRLLMSTFVFGAVATRAWRPVGGGGGEGAVGAPPPRSSPNNEGFGGAGGLSLLISYGMAFRLTCSTSTVVLSFRTTTGSGGRDDITLFALSFSGSFSTFDFASSAGTAFLSIIAAIEFSF